MVSFALLLRPRFARRLKGCGHVDNASALPTCPQPQQQTQKPINAGSRNKRSLAARIPGNHVRPPTNSAEEAAKKVLSSATWSLGAPPPEKSSTVSPSMLIVSAVPGDPSTAISPAPGTPFGDQLSGSSKSPAAPPFQIYCVIGSTLRPTHYSGIQLRWVIFANLRRSYKSIHGGSRADRQAGDQPVSLASGSRQPTT